jgi:uncharacterized protein YbjQ (UPF0145 family)
MDLSALIMPGAQQLAAAVFNDTWAGVRDAVARRLGRGKHEETATAATALESTANRARAAGDHDAVVAYWAGYLEGLAAGRPDLSDLLESLASGMSAQPAPQVHNNVTGTIYGKANIIGGSVHGGITM